MSSVNTYINSFKVNLKGDIAIKLSLCSAAELSPRMPEGCRIIKNLKYWWLRQLLYTIQIHS